MIIPINQTPVFMLMLDFSMQCQNQCLACDFSFRLCSQSGSNLCILTVILFFIIFPTMMIYIQVCQICHQWCRPLWRILPAVLSLLLMLRPQLLWISNPPPIIGIINDDSSSPISHTKTYTILFDYRLSFWTDWPPICPMFWFYRIDEHAMKKLCLLLLVAWNEIWIYCLFFYRL